MGCGSGELIERRSLPDRRDGASGRHASNRTAKGKKLRVRTRRLKARSSCSASVIECFIFVQQGKQFLPPSSRRPLFACPLFLSHHVICLTVYVWVGTGFKVHVFNMRSEEEETQPQEILVLQMPRTGPPAVHVPQHASVCVSVHELHIPRFSLSGTVKGSAINPHEICSLP